MVKGAFLDASGSVRNGWKILGFGILLYLCMMLLGLLGLWKVLGFEWGMALAVLVPTAFCLRLERQPLPVAGLKPTLRWGGDFALGTIGGLLLMLLVAGLIFAVHGFHWQRSGGAHFGELAAGAWLYLAVAVNEELLFRGYLFQRLMKGTGTWIALPLMGLWFAYAHWDNPGMGGSVRLWAMLNIFLAGLLLGLAYLKTQRLALPMGIHLGWNWAQGSLLGFGVSGTMDTHGWVTPVFEGRPEWLTGGSFGLEASLPCALLCSLAILGLALWTPSPRA
ncbi:MAG: CPBP family intramembrane metalloprotease [Holophagaceae bacterium]|nr:CPBP family intramembrane metalloprotease [Holophagaceae bacterium]